MSALAVAFGTRSESGRDGYPKKTFDFTTPARSPCAQPCRRQATGRACRGASRVEKHAEPAAVGSRRWQVLKTAPRIAPHTADGQPKTRSSACAVDERSGRKTSGVRDNSRCFLAPARQCALGSPGVPGGENGFRRLARPPRAGGLLSRLALAVSTTSTKISDASAALPVCQSVCQSLPSAALRNRSEPPTHLP